MRQTAVFVLLSSAAALGCQSTSKASEPTARPAAAPAVTAPVSAASVPAPAAPYTVRIVPGDAAVAKPATSLIEVTPGPGFHMNKDFPTRLRLTAAPGVTLGKNELLKEDAELSDEQLRFSVAFTATTAGQTTLSALGDFSICNDTTCKLIRDEKLAWDVDVKP
ncbi:MAG: hypothetical protein EXR76_16475 [Myxococcales bacterium]|nr:hypothetical protein [Myxococcales bacterium]